MKKIIILLLTILPFYSYTQSSLILKGIIDFTVPSGGSDGKAIHVLAIDTITDLSLYGIGTANNGGGSDGQEYTFDPISVYPGDNILVARSISAMSSYFDSCFTEFDHTLQATLSIDLNGDDAIELFYNGNVVETFGDINIDGTGECWEYRDSWAYKSNSGDSTCLGGIWIFGGVDCTDGSITSNSSNCPYPFCLNINGCIDPNAYNYNPLATIDDSSCIYCNYGCMDSLACNYDPSATCDDGSCLTNYGCTDSLACNFDPLATCDDGGCLTTYGCTDSLATNYDPLATCPDSCIFGTWVYVQTITGDWGDEVSWDISDPTTGITYLTGSGYSSYGSYLDSVILSDPGCYDLNCYDSYGDGWNGGYVEIINPATGTVNYTLGTGFASGSYYLDGFCLPWIYGCTDPNALNYDSLATTDDGSCGFPCSQYTINMYDAYGDGWSGNDLTFTDSTGTIFFSTTLQTGSIGSDSVCIPTGCITVSCDGGSWQSEVSWDVVDSSGVIILSGGAPYTDTICLPVITGCTDPNADNYDSTASANDGSCIYASGIWVYFQTFTGFSGNLSWDISNPTTGFTYYTGSGYNSWGSYLDSVNLPVPGCYDFNCYQMTGIGGGWGGSLSYVELIDPATGTVLDTLGTGFNSGVYYLDGFCLPWGCTDPNAYNFDSIAGIDDGSCVFYGCTDSNAINYDSGANFDDSSCHYCDLSNNIIISNPSDSILCDGLAVCNSTSSLPITSYIWTDFSGNVISTQNFVSNLCNDIYFLNVTDSIGCSVIDTIISGIIFGCTDSTAFNFEWFANMDNGSCIPFIFGCTDSTAFNYDPFATADDSTCCLLVFSQIGQDIYGDSLDRFGFSVSLSGDGNIVAIGAPYNDGNGTVSGQVRIYQNSGGTWTQLGQDIYGESYYDNSGRSVSLSGDGNIVAIGAPSNDGNGTNSGQVRIYQNIGGTWNQIGQDIYGDSLDLSGYSISLSDNGNTVAIGAPENDENGIRSGLVRIYQNSGGIWTQLGQDIYGDDQFEECGRSLSLSDNGNIVAIGSPYDDENGSFSGEVRIYQNSGGTWTQIGQDIYGESSYDWSGYSISLSGDGNTVAIGAPGNNGNGTNSGQVRIYQNSGGTWTQLGQDIYGENYGDEIGSSLYLSGDGNTVAIGAPSNDGNGTNSGQVQIYQNSGGTWTQIGQDIYGDNIHDYSGYSISLSDNGNTVAIGAPYNDGKGTNSGQVRIISLYPDCAGCIDPLAVNFDSTASADDGSCCFISGCTDSTSFNYDSLACYDDGSCTPFIYGCLDTLAFNYDTLANTDDGSCLYCDLTNTFLISQNTTGNCDGFIVANSSSSYSPITYLWSTGSTQNNITNLCAGIYTVTITDNVGCTIEDTVYMNVILGCIDSLALNYDPLANTDDGSCTYSSNCTSPKPTGLYAYDIIDTRAKIGWDNMNDSNCMVWKYFVRYREVGTSQWTTKSAGVGNGLCNFGLNTVTKQLLNLTPSTTYEFRMKAFYCGGTSSNYSTPVQFTTADVCPDMTNLTTTTFNGNQAKVRFNWDTTGAYTFARILLRVDTAGSNWQTAGGFGVYYPTLFVNKFGLTPGQSYRAQGRTFCDSNITAYRSPTWTSPIFWTQPGSIRMNGGTSINNLDVYPNPSRDIFNISFNSEEIQDLSIRIINVVGAEVYREDRENFIGEYTKQVSIDNYGKGIYFLEIETKTGIVNKKLILQ